MPGHPVLFAVDAKHVIAALCGKNPGMKCNVVDIFRTFKPQDPSLIASLLHRNDAYGIFMDEKIHKTPRVEDELTVSSIELPENVLPFSSDFSSSEKEGQDVGLAHLGYEVTGKYESGAKFRFSISTETFYSWPKGLPLSLGEEETDFSWEEAYYVGNVHVRGLFQRDINLIMNRCGGKSFFSY